ncbi:hypothetical protein GCM10022215_28590 [Nocardioides fonticola]|uniref:Nudix hydrolase domain-containing protein n=1 Tax=Nocardioides fonticola TaxID=450363 RepID=A0ABP7XN76_9ACTN
MATAPRAQRLAAYVVVVRDHQVLLCRLSERVADTELWTLPGGGVEHGEHPRDAVVREVYEETGLQVSVGETARVHSVHQQNFERDGLWDYHSVRLVYDGHVAADAPAPRVVEVDGTTAEARWISLTDVVAGRVPLVPLAREELRAYEPVQVQRLTASALAVRGTGEDAEVLLTRISALGAHPGRWTLPGGGVDHGETPAATVARELAEETGLTGEVGALVTVADTHFHGTAPSGRHEDYHAVQLVFAVRLPDDAVPEVVEQGGTTDAAAWVRVGAIESGAIEVADVVTVALAADGRQPST